MNILAIDTSSANGSAALRLSDGRIVRARISETLDHARNLVPVTNALLSENGLELGDIDIAVFGKGPGSFIGTRIAMVAVQALNQSFGTKLFAASSMLAYDFSGLPFACPEERHVYTCRVKTGSYHCIVRRAQDTGIPTENDEREMSDAEFTAMLGPNDVVIGPLTAKNMAALEEACKVHTISLYPDAARLMENNLQAIESAAK